MCGAGTVAVNCRDAALPLAASPRPPPHQKKVRGAFVRRLLFSAFQVRAGGGTVRRRDSYSIKRSASHATKSFSETRLRTCLRPNARSGSLYKSGRSLSRHWGGLCRSDHPSAALPYLRLPASVYRFICLLNKDPPLVFTANCGFLSVPGVHTKTDKTLQ